MSSFASIHADPSKGFRAVPRWFRGTDFWHGLNAAHRAVLDELYHRMASQPVTQKGTAIELKRGQWAISYQALANSSGATVKQVRKALEHAIAAGIVGHEVIVKKVASGTIHLSLFSWRDFDTYDILCDMEGKSKGKPLGKSEGKPKGNIIHKGNTPSDYTKGNTQAEEIGADAPGGVAAAGRGASSSPPAAHGSGAAGEAISPITCDNQIPTASDEWVEMDSPIHSGRWDELDGDDEDGYPAPSMSLTAEAVQAGRAPASAPAADPVPAADPIPAAPAETPAKAPAVAPDSSGAPKATSTAPASTKRPSEARSKTKRQPLTDERKAEICSSAKAMESYLLEGPMNWRRWLKPDVKELAERAGVVNWTAQTFAGFWWWRVSQSRERYNQPIALPDFGRLLKEITRAMERMTSAQLLDYLDTLLDNWHLVRFLIGDIGYGLVLNETVFNHSLVKDAMTKLMNMDPGHRKFYMGRMSEEWSISAAA
jgi:hypothetical protein